MRLLATRARIEREQERAVFERERLERERAMFEAKVVTEHPKWKRIKRHLLEQFAGDTAALRKIELAILEAEAG
jgi:hypothetical protein